MSNTTDNVRPSWSNNSATKHKHLNYLTETEVMQIIHTDILEDNGDSSTVNDDELFSDNDIDNSIYQDFVSVSNGVSNIAVISPQQQVTVNVTLDDQPQQNVQTSENNDPAEITTPDVIDDDTLNVVSETPGTSQVAPSDQNIASESQITVDAESPMPRAVARTHRTIWRGSLEWVVAKPPLPGSHSPQKATRHVMCRVTARLIDGEPELKADNWPEKLVMQLMPKCLLGNIAGVLRISKSVVIKPQNCVALHSLTRIMKSGFGGCVHFTSAPSTCNVKVLILFYSNKKRTYIGFIPNDQVAFIERLRQVVRRERSHMLRHEQCGFTAATSMNRPFPIDIPFGFRPQLPALNAAILAAAQRHQGLTMSPTNNLAVAGGQTTQNVATSSGPSIGGIDEVLVQNVPNSIIPRLGVQGIQQACCSQVNQPGDNPARQQNLGRINWLKQILEAVQHQEQQYKSQLERISHMKTLQLQEALQIAQQTEIQYKMLEQQRVTGSQVSQGPSTQQQQMTRPAISTNDPRFSRFLQQLRNLQHMIGAHATMSTDGATTSRMDQQIPNNPGGDLPQPFDDVGHLDFL